MPSPHVFSESAAVAPGGGRDAPGLYDAEQVNQWRSAVDAVHARGDKIIARLWHPAADGALDADAMEAVVDAFRVAAEGASDAGFDGVELAGTPPLSGDCRHQVLAALASVWGPSRVVVR